MRARLGLIPILVWGGGPVGLVLLLFPISHIIPSLDLFFKSLIAIWFFLLIVVWLFNKIELKGNMLVVRTYYSFSLLGSGRSREHPKTSKNRIIDINSIKGIKIITTTPLISVRKNISEINWRDRVEINYQIDTQNNNVATVELFLFPGFKKILKEIIRNKQEIQISYSKLSGRQNLSEPQNPDYK